MEKLIFFNGVYVLLTTGQRLSEVQSYADRADIIISVYRNDIRILQDKTKAQTERVCQEK